MNEPKGNALPQESPWIVDVDVATFEREVIERSRTVPVVIDLWAEWCGPCKTLGPILERKAREGGGRFVLAKVDVDRNPELVQAFRVQGIPAVLAVVGGKLANGFQGALPEPEIDRFLDEIAPPVAEESPVEEARALAADGRTEEAIKLLRAFLRERPDHTATRIALVVVLAQAGKPAEARLVFDKLSEAERESDEAKAALAQIGFAENRGDLVELERAVAERPDDVAARIALGKAHVAAQDHQAGLEELLQAVRMDPARNQGEAKKAMLEVFDILGLEDPVANDYRFKLSMELFS